MAKPESKPAAEGEPVESEAVEPILRGDRDPYRFGHGRKLELRPGTSGWSAEDLHDPDVRCLYDNGRYEIVNGVLQEMPASFYAGGMVADRLSDIVVFKLRSEGIPYSTSNEADIQIQPDRIRRLDKVIVVGNDLAKFRALQFERGPQDWHRQNLIIPPTVGIESISQGHERRDRVEKRREYAAFGIPNYWIVDYFTRRLDILTLDGTDYRDEAVGTDDDVLKPACFPGLEVNLTELWGDG
ncbi:MAG: Uma2 family endonuclease [Planctomycetota bacterium]